jgi:hypothetical protein
VQVHVHLSHTCDQDGWRAFIIKLLVRQRRLLWHANDRRLYYHRPVHLTTNLYLETQLSTYVNVHLPLIFRVLLLCYYVITRRRCVVSVRNDLKLLSLALYTLYICIYCHRVPCSETHLPPCSHVLSPPHQIITYKTKGSYAECRCAISPGSPLRESAGIVRDFS